jgi:hypothetical protein
MSNSGNTNRSAIIGVAALTVLGVIGGAAAIGSDPSPSKSLMFAIGSGLAAILIFRKLVAAVAAAIVGGLTYMYLAPYVVNMIH